MYFYKFLISKKKNMIYITQDLTAHVTRTLLTWNYELSFNAIDYDRVYPVYVHVSTTLSRILLGGDAKSFWAVIKCTARSAAS